MSLPWCGAVFFFVHGLGVVTRAKLLKCRHRLELLLQGLLSLDIYRRLLGFIVHIFVLLMLPYEMIRGLWAPINNAMEAGVPLSRRVYPSKHSGLMPKWKSWHTCIGSCAGVSFLHALPAAVQIENAPAAFHLYMDAFRDDGKAGLGAF